jgi:hypothetical protein
MGACVVEFDSYDRMLKNSPLLSNLSEEERAKLASSLQKCSFKEGDKIIGEGDPAEAMFVSFRFGDPTCTRNYFSVRFPAEARLRV